MKLVNEHAPGIKALLSTSVSQSVTRRCVDAGFDIYWWNPLYDDAQDPNSYSAACARANRCSVPGHGKIPALLLPVSPMQSWGFAGSL